MNCSTPIADQTLAMRLVIFFCALGLAAIALTITPQLRSEVKIPDEYKQGGFAIGCQAYTFNHYTVFEAIEKTAEAGGKVMSGWRRRAFNSGEAAGAGVRSVEQKGHR